MRILCLILFSFLFVGNAHAESLEKVSEKFLAGKIVSSTGCPEKVSKEQVLTGTILSSFINNNIASIVLDVNGDQKEFVINADKLIETREMIGDVVSIHYAEKQYWDAHDELCVNNIDIQQIEILQSSLEKLEERVLGSGNLVGTLLDVGEEGGFCYLVIQESYGKFYFPISCGEMSSFVSLRGNDIGINFFVSQYYYEPDEVWLKNYEIREIIEL